MSDQTFTFISLEYRYFHIWSVYSRLAKIRITKFRIFLTRGDRGGTLVKVLCYKSEGRWFDPSWFQWIFY